LLLRELYDENWLLLISVNIMSYWWLAPTSLWVWHRAGDDLVGS